LQLPVANSPVRVFADAKMAIAFANQETTLVSQLVAQRTRAKFLRAIVVPSPLEPKLFLYRHLEDDVRCAEIEQH
jgi:hypothetical protein